MEVAIAVIGEEMKPSIVVEFPQALSGDPVFVEEV